MRRLGILTALLALSSCSPADPPPTAAMPPRKPSSVLAPAPAPAPKVPAPAPPEPPPATPVAPPPVMEPPRPKPTTEPARPARLFPTGNVHLPVFTFRPLDGGGPVLINGEVLSEHLPCLWSITDAIEFDPKIPVGSWPPEGAVYVSSTSHPESGNAELYIDRTPKLPHLRPHEAVLYVRGQVGGRALLGGLRLFVEGLRYVDYTPLVNPEGEEASRFLRSIWFERIRAE